MEILKWIGIVLLAIFVIYIVIVLSFATYVNSPSTHNATPLKRGVSNQYHKKDGKVIYVMDGNFFSLGGAEIEGADPDTFEVIDQSYAKDINTLYYDGKPVVGTSPNSVMPVMSELQKTSVNSGYLISDGKVLCSGEVIEGADLESFSYLLGHYAMDKHYIYHFIDDKIPRKAVPTVIINAGDEYIQHAEQILCHGKVISNQAHSFEIINDEYSKDSLHVFSRGEILDGVDAQSFVILCDYYRKDKNQAYYFNYPILKSDPATFKVLSDVISKDHNNLYYNEFLIQNKKPSEISQSDADNMENGWKWTALHLNETTVIMVPSDEMERITYQFFVYNNEVYATDKKLEGVKPNDVIVLSKKDSDEQGDEEKIFVRIASEIFYHDKLIPEADPTTFEIISEHFSKDNQHVYWGENKVINANPLTFEYKKSLYADENESGEYVLAESKYEYDFFD